MAVKNNRMSLLVLATVFALTLSIGRVNAVDYENYYGIKMNNQEYNNLINLGFSSDEIYYMGLETFEENKNADATLLSKNEKYYKSIYTDLNGETKLVEISKDEYDSQGLIATRGTVETEYKRVVSTLAQNGSKFRYKVSVFWKQPPKVKSYDIIGIGFEGNKYGDTYIDSSVYFNYYYCNSSGDCQTTSEYYDKKKTSTGGSTVYKIPSSAHSLTAALWFDVSKNTTNTITRLAMCGDYSHATSKVNASEASYHDIDIDGIILASDISNSYDEIPCAYTTWNGSW